MGEGERSDQIKRQSALLDQFDGDEEEEKGESRKLEGRCNRRYYIRGAESLAWNTPPVQIVLSLPTVQGY